MAFMFNFRQELKEGKPLIGTLQALNSPEVTEMLAAAGFDWLWVDLEHSTIDAEGAQRILQAAGCESLPATRYGSRSCWTSDRPG
jgi:2-keto-3-deoxy-L-rhamnonate aldolase RhmA